MKVNQRVWAKLCTRNLQYKGQFTQIHSRVKERKREREGEREKEKNIF